MLASLDCLASAPPPWSDDRSDPRWPDLTNAVHWLIDDTFWDEHDPSDDIGSLLTGEAEAEALRQVVAALLEVAAVHGATGSDRSWFSDERWPLVRQLSAHAARVMRVD